MISILLPTYNQAKFLPDALAALEKQTYRDFKIIACNDGSTDETGEILWKSNVEYVSHLTNRGTAAAINSAAERIRGDVEYVAWVSSDNVMYPEWLETLKAYLDKGFQAAYSAYRRIDLFPDTLKPRPRLIEPGQYHRDRLIGSLECYFGPSFLVRREAWIEHQDGLAHDYDWWLRFEERAGPIAYHPAPLCEYRMGPWQTGRNRPAELLDDARRRQREAMERRCLTPVSNAAI